MALKQAFSQTDGVTDLLYVATNIDVISNPVHGDFTPDLSSLAPPLNPGSLDERFGIGSWYEWSDLYVRFYNKEANIWTDGSSGVVNADAKADVETQRIALMIYDSQVKDFNVTVCIQKDIQWRKRVAQDLIDICV